MGHSTRQNSRSLFTTMAILITATVVLVLGGQGAYTYLNEQQQMVTQMKQDARVSINSLHRNITDLIDAYAINQYDNLIATEMELRHHLAIIVEDYNMGRILGQQTYISGKIRAPSGHMVDYNPNLPSHQEWLERSYYSESTQIERSDGTVIGSVTIHIAAQQMRERLNNILYSTLFNSLAIALLLIFLLFIALNRLIVSPLSQLSNAITDSDSDGIPRKPLPSYPYREIGLLSDSMNNMLEVLRTSRQNLREEQSSLQRSLRINRLILETIPDLLWLKDTDGVYLMCNPNFEKFFGAKEGEIVGKTDYDFVDSEQADFFKQHDQKAMHAGKPTTNEEWIVFAEGGRRALMETTKVPMVDHEGKLAGIMGIAHDITERFEAQQKEREIIRQLDTQKMRFQLAVEGSQDGLWDWDPISNTVFYSSQWKQMLGYSDEEIGDDFEEWRSRVHPDDLENALKTIDEHLKGKTPLYENPHRLRCKDGSWKWILARGKAQFNDKGEAVRVVGFHTDITEQIRHQEELKHSATHDALTHLPNRFLFNELMQKVMQRSKRNHTSLALLYIDLDGFKEINDEHGHRAGDVVLIAIADRLRSSVREEDAVARIGGDEFVIAVSDLEHRDEVLKLLRRLLKDLKQPIHYKNSGPHKLQITASIGVTFYPQEEELGSEALLRQADQAMYTAKNSGKNQYSLFSLEMDSSLKEQVQLSQSFKKAFEHNELQLYYQPQVNMASGEVVGFEALLRWRHNEHGILSPDSFLPLLNQERALMLKLGQWVLESVFEQQAQWLSQGHEFKISINISAHEFKDRHITNSLESLFKRFPQVKPQHLALEILETSALEDTVEAKQMILASQRMGVQVALDDFGTGYSTLSYLRDLPVDTLKLDKSFVTAMLHDSGSFSIIEAAMGLADAFRCEVVAEGVESSEHGTMLLQMGCNVAQGFAIAHPMPADEVLDWVHSHHPNPVWQKTERLPYRDRNILYATIEHRHWVQMLEKHLKNAQNNPQPELDPSHCRFGQWLKGEAKMNYDSRQLAIIAHIHTQLHDQAEALITGREQSGSKKIYQLHEQLLQELDNLITLPPNSSH